MKPYVELNGDRLYLPSIVDTRFEVCIHSLNSSEYHFLLCPIVKHRYVQATGAVLERDGQELKFAVQNGLLVMRTFPLDGLESLRIYTEKTIAPPQEEPASEIESENQ